ncbi:hypothetical protein VPG01_112 [Vibrio phage VPG01]|nr:hypothetical protein VPG01_112 [Vibrio phage VPG01]
MKLANGMEVQLRPGVLPETVQKCFKYLAADSDGEVFAFEEKPYLQTSLRGDNGLHVWDCLNGDCDYIGDIAVSNYSGADTRATLTEI